MWTIFKLFDTNMDYVIDTLTDRFVGVEGSDEEIASFVQRGLLGPSQWYLRHRDERAEQRVHSLPRKYPNFSGAQSYMTLKVSNNQGSAMLVPPEEDPLQKQRLLKEALLAKRAAKKAQKL